MATARERLSEWLRDAHAAEQQAHTMLTGVARRLPNYPEFSTGLQQHGERSGRQAEQLRTCLSQLSESPSVVKNLVGQLTAIGQTLSGLIVGDEVIKAALATSTFAHMEVTSYRILVAAAQTAGETMVAETCELLLAEEVEFADWLDQQLPSLTSEYLHREETPAVTAKH